MIDVQYRLTTKGKMRRLGFYQSADQAASDAAEMLDALRTGKQIDESMAAKAYPTAMVFLDGRPIRTDNYQPQLQQPPAPAKERPKKVKVSRFQTSLWEEEK